MLIDERLKKQLNFIIKADKMKSIFRQTLLIDKTRRENDAEHSWHIALMALTLKEYAASEIDLDKVIKMALVHDLVEIYAGDTFAYDAAGYENKEQKEKQAAEKLFGSLPCDQNKEFRTLWDEFEKMETPEALYAAAVDRLQPFINNSKTQGHTWVLHNVTKAQVYKRMEVIKTAMPKLWEFVESVIQDSVKKGYISENSDG